MIISMAIRREAHVLDVNAKGTVVVDGCMKGSPLYQYPINVNV